MDRNHSIDALRILAAFLVVVIHSAGPYVMVNMTVLNASFFIGNWYDAFARAGVPLFVMISGFLLLEKVETTRECYARLFRRVISPLLFWVFFYLCFSALLMNAHDYFDGILLVKQLFLGIPFYHLWYLFMLLGLYAVTPFLQKLVQKYPARTANNLALCALFLGVLLEIWDAYFANNQLFILWFLKYVGYYLLGFTMPRVAAEYLVRYRSYLLVLLPALYIGASWSIAKLTIVTAVVWHKSLFFYNYTSPLVVIGSLSLYMFFHLFVVKSIPMSRFASLTFGIYLIHPFFLELFRNFGWLEPFHNLAIDIPVMAAVVFCLAAAVSVMFKKNDWLAKTI